jgi:hypothetical protein
MKIALLPKGTRDGRFKLQLHRGDEKSLFGKMPNGSRAAMLPRGTAKRSRQARTLDWLRAKLAVGGGEATVTATGER